MVMADSNFQRPSKRELGRSGRGAFSRFSTVGAIPPLTAGAPRPTEVSRLVQVKLWRSVA